MTTGFNSKRIGVLTFMHSGNPASKSYYMEGLIRFIVASTSGIEPVTRAQESETKSYCLVFVLSRLACNLFICVCVCVFLRAASINTTRVDYFETKYEQRSNKCCNCIC